MITKAIFTGGKLVDSVTLKQVETGVGARQPGIARRLIEGITGAEWFGPAQPLAPVAPPATEPRVFDYPFAVNIQYQPGSEDTGKPSFAQMRALADAYDLLRLVIETRKDQIAKIPWSFVVKEEPDEPISSIKKRTFENQNVQKLTKFFKRPDGQNGWSTWLRKGLEDMFVTDTLSILPLRSVGGDVIGLDVIDGATIKRLVDEGGRTPLPPSPAYQQIIKGMPAVDLSMDELVYAPRNPRPHLIYGYSPVQQIIVTVNLALRRQLSQLDYYTAGNIPEALACVPDSWTSDQIKLFQDMFDTLSGDQAARRRLRFIPSLGTGGLLQTKEAMLKDEMDEWLARVVCYCFSVPPTPFVKQMNRATAQSVQEAAIQEGLIPILLWWEELINYFVERFFQIDDIVFKWNNEKEPDPAVQNQMEDTDIRNGSRSVDEVRIARGDDPIGMGHAVFTASGPILLSQFTQQGESADELDAEEQVAGGDETPEDEATLNDETTEKLAKKEPPSRIIDPSKYGPERKKAERELQKNLEKALAAVRVGAVDTIIKGIESGLTVDDIVGKIGLDALTEMVAENTVLFQRVFSESGLKALGSLNVNEREIVNLVNQDALSYAEKRAAEMVGRRLVDGRLIENPNAKWAISDSTREGLRSLVEQAYEQGWTPAQLKKQIEAHYEFSRGRAEMIARTEMSRASMTGAIEAWRKSGVVTSKVWLLSADHPEDKPDVCDDNAEQGPIPLDEPFASGDDAPVAHPNCWCSMAPVVETE
jgi:hypothetical protein